MEYNNFMSDEDTIEDLLSLLHQKSWKLVAGELRRRVLTEVALSCLLHFAVGVDEIPYHVIKAILKRSDQPYELTLRVNDLGETALHILVSTLPDRFDIVELLVGTSPEIADKKDSLSCRPIDTLCEKIFIVEEAVKYGNRSEEYLDDLWETVNALSTIPSLEIDVSPSLHICLQNKALPFALKQRAIKRYHHQLAQVDDKGQLPLHIISASPTTTEDEDDEDEDILRPILLANPSAASIADHEGNIPFKLACQAERVWRTGLSDLLAVYPAGIMQAGIPQSLLQHVFLKVLSQGEETVAYAILRILVPMIIGRH